MNIVTTAWVGLNTLSRPPSKAAFEDCEVGRKALFVIDEADCVDSGVEVVDASTSPPPADSDMCVSAVVVVNGGVFVETYESSTS